MSNILIMIATIAISLNAMAGNGSTGTFGGGTARTAIVGGVKIGGGGDARIAGPLITKNQWGEFDLPTLGQREMLKSLARMSRTVQGDLVVLGTVGWSKPGNVATTAAPKFEIQWPKLPQYPSPQWPRSPWNSFTMIDEAVLKDAKTGDFVVAFRDQLAQSQAGRSRIRAFVIPKNSITSYDQRDFYEMLSKQVEQYPYFK